MNEHTPLPWHTDTMWSCPYVCGVPGTLGQMKMPNPVARVDYGPMSKWRGNAELICKAVNLHDELVDGVEYAMGQLAFLHPGVSVSTDRCLERLKALLTKVKE